MLTVSTKVFNGVAEIELAGRFDFSGRKAFREAYDSLLLNAGVQAIEIGLSGVEYIDSSALGMLLLLRERAEEANKKVILHSAQNTVARVLSVANFGRLFEIRG